jgi:hypothetical protein
MADRKRKPASRAPGRPKLEAPPISDEVREEVLKFAATGAPDKILASSVGVDPSTWSKWRLREEPSFVQFFQELERARARGDLALFACIRKAAGEGDWRAARSLLVSRHPELSERRQVDVAVTGQDPVAAALMQLVEQDGE